jgi:predicted secreted protein
VNHLKVAFVAHCLANQNAKVDEYAKCPGVVTPVVERLRAHGYRIQQLPCPEMAFLGVNRWWQGKELYDKRNYRRHCRTLARFVAPAIEEFHERGYDIVVVGLDGSPSSGVRLTGSTPTWGGRPESDETDYAIVPGMGVWIEELKAELEERGIPWPRATGIAMDSPDFDMDESVAELESFLEEATTEAPS